MQIYHAPLQGYTERAYRLAHAEVCGGVDRYYAPFIRLDKGEVRRRDLRDVQPDEKALVPQVIARDADEFRQLSNMLIERGFREIDLNTGCPFPMQTRQGRGAGLLDDAERVGAIVGVMAEQDAHFSIKMRLGLDDAAACMNLLPLLNDAPIEQIALHPRIGRQQYKGEVDMAAFERFAAACKKPLIYNGDLRNPEDVTRMMDRFPMLHGVMIGRGLLARPTLACEIREGRVASAAEIQDAVLAIHDRVLDHYRQTLEGGDHQVLQKILPFWEYQEPNFDHRFLKAIKKARSLSDYMAVVRSH